MNLAFIIITCAFAITFLVCIYALVLAYRGRAQKPPLDLERYKKNPLISPLPHREWETQGTFNPAAIQDDEGKVHLFYRAIGSDGLSRIGYASSPDGQNFNDRSPYPVYQPSAGFGLPDSGQSISPPEYNPLIYTSGGGWGGCEDPRTVRIGDRVYMTYTAFGGWDSMRIGLTSIKLDDLKHKRWKWKRPTLISPPGQVSKNWLIFPEKINGKYAILHSIAPKILVEYEDSLDHMAFIKSSRPHGPQPGPKDAWDYLVRGGGPPPLKTDIGWLLLYHAMDRNDPGRYKVGAMILQSDDPTKVLYRSPKPVLSPDMPYENDGKPNIVYASGAVVKAGELYVYYGGGDKHVCVAQTPLQPLLDWLVKYGKQ